MEALTKPGSNSATNEFDQVLRHDTLSTRLWIENSDSNPEESVDEVMERAFDARSID